MININTFMNKLLLIINKESGGYFTPEERNDAIAMASQQMFNEQYGHYRKYSSPGSPKPLFSWEVSQNLSDQIGVFLKHRDIVINSQGIYSLPDDYYHVSALAYRYFQNPDCAEDPSIVPDHRPIRIMSNDRIYNRIKNPIVPASKKKPICTFYGITGDHPNGYIQFYPTNLGLARFDYLRTPAVPVWGYTIQSGVPVYDATSSIDIEWPGTSENELIMMAAKFLGINLREDQLYQYAQAEINSGI